jgi:hypothetical protein
VRRLAGIVSFAGAILTLVAGGYGLYLAGMVRLITALSEDDDAPALVLAQSLLVLLGAVTALPTSSAMFRGPALRAASIGTVIAGVVACCGQTWCALVPVMRSEEGSWPWLAAQPGLVLVAGGLLGLRAARRDGAFGADGSPSIRTAGTA